MKKTPSLSNALRLNAGFSSICGLTGLISPGFISQLLGLELDGFYQLIGSGLLMFALLLLLLANKAPIPRLLAKLVSLGDILWVIATAIILALGSTFFSLQGQVILIAVALCVGFFALLQLRALPAIQSSGSRHDLG
ncbi:MAG: hypothetical protein HRU20_12065 [Pseudomonadales bacterium]|nr:hypothetical protein [Pseudomonadales bacterium]